MNPNLYANGSNLDPAEQFRQGEITRTICANRVRKKIANDEIIFVVPEGSTDKEVFLELVDKEIEQYLKSQ
jgi:hypothetical protein